ncbi:ubiquitin-conjugating enzyme E2 G1 [Platysternon megacephalum]|uniref:Ubiquitin-conjugating enzyme E2 G1 n=1 Tax=Platysternon megacephalum TaxID=55544 RepID=A0A4D9ESM7_9SAUR|nr:ubiquitin-conjugating enzyme E2 G1 [Platysternon megacephalum]
MLPSHSVAGPGSGACGVLGIRDGLAQLPSWGFWTTPGSRPRMRLQKDEVEAEWGLSDGKQCTGDGASERQVPGDFGRGQSPSPCPPPHESLCRPPSQAISESPSPKQPVPTPSVVWPQPAQVLGACRDYDPYLARGWGEKAA